MFCCARLPSESLVSRTADFSRQRLAEAATVESESSLGAGTGTGTGTGRGGGKKRRSDVMAGSMVCCLVIS